MNALPVALPANFPVELTEHSIWTTWDPSSGSKKPSISPGHKGRPYSSVASAPGIGILLAHKHNFAVLDLDFPGTKAEKAALQALAATTPFYPSSWPSDAYYAFLQANTSLFVSLASYGLLWLLKATYVELSPSGLGFHIFLRIPTVEKTGPNNLRHSAIIRSALPLLPGQLTLGNGFMTVTRLPLAGCAGTLATVTLSDLLPLLPTSHVRAAALPRTPPSAPSTPLTDDLQAALQADAQAVLAPSEEPADDLSPLELANVTYDVVLDALRTTPCTPDRRTQSRWEALTGRAYSHYDYWLSVGMAVHQWGSLTANVTRAFVLWHDWSMQDKENYKGEADLDQHWKSFKPVPTGITVKTLLALAEAMRFDYPRPIMLKGNKTPFPLINEYVNFEYLMNFYDIKVYQDDKFYLTGDPDIMEQYFSAPGRPMMGKYYGPFTVKSLATATKLLCQDSQWRKLDTTTTLCQDWLNTECRELDLFWDWLKTPFDDLPPEFKTIVDNNKTEDVRQYKANSTPEYLFKCMNTAHHNEADRELYFKMFKKILFQMIKFRKPEILKMPFRDNGGMLILQGPENTFKSTFCKQLVPPALECVMHMVNQEVKSDKSARDFLRAFALKSIVVIDDFDNLIDLNSSYFKNLLSSNDPSFTDIYETTETKRNRRAVVVASTNKHRMVLSPEGTRRLWFIPVNKIDTKAAARVNLHWMYNNLEKEFDELMARGEFPWLLTQEEIDHLDQLNRRFASVSDLDLVLSELFPFRKTMPYNYFDGVNLITEKHKLMTSNQVRALLMLHGQSHIKPTQLEHALTRLCEKWTETEKGKEVFHKNGRIFGGQLYYNRNKAKGDYDRHKWVMPPLVGE